MVSSFSLIPTTSTYENRTYGIRVQYPSDWSVAGTNGSTSAFANFFPPVGSNNAATVALGTMTLNNVTTLSNYALSTAIKDYEMKFPAFKLLELNTNSTLAGNPAYTLIGTYQDPSFGLQKLMDVGTIIGDKVYYVQYFANT
ncbi:MAG: hypothetical protein WA667_18805 [Candidatus Nitrosopolaris sp.]